MSLFLPNVGKMNLKLLKMVEKEETETPIRPVLLKFGLVLTISLGGVVLYTYLRTKRIKPQKPKSKPSQRSLGHGRQADSRTESGELRDDDHALQNSSLRKTSSQNYISDRSSSDRHSGDRDGLLLPEFNDLVKECNMAATMDNVCPRKNGDSLFRDVEFKCSQHDEHAKEIKRLRNRVKILQEKERNLELQLLEYYGIKEQETAVMELQNRLRLNTMEAKLCNLKIESLLLDNRRLEAQVADYANAATELESAKTKIKMLRKKLKSEGEQNREQILKLQDRVMTLQEQEKKADEIDQDLKMQRQERDELKAELEGMKKCYQVLKLENSDLAQKLEYVKMLAANAIDNEEVLELKEESRRLKQQNEDSTKEIERLQADRCTDLEELVYLRWINACLRYELRNYQLGDGKTIARDLSKKLSPQSEEHAKKLILEYAHKEGSVEKGMDTNYLDSDQWSSSQASCLTDEHGDSPVDPPAANKTNHSSKSKVFAKLRKLLQGKGSSRRNQEQASPLERTISVDNIPGRYSCDFPSGFSVGGDGGSDDLIKTSRNSSGASSRRSLDIPRSYSRGTKSITGESSNCSRRTSDDDSSSILRRIDSLTGYDNDWSPAGIQPHQDTQDAAKNELLKYAEALKNCGPKSFRSSTSFESG